MNTKSVLVPLAQGCEELEAVTLLDLFTRAGMKVISASLEDDTLVTCSRGTQIVAKMTLDEAVSESFDLIALPGGLPGADHLNDDSRIQNLLKQMHAQGAYIAAVCAAPKVLVTAGLLDNRKATSFPGVIDQTPANNMQYSEEAVVVDGNIVTSRGPGTAMEFALTLIELVAGNEKRQEVEQGLVRS